MILLLLSEMQLKARTSSASVTAADELQTHFSQFHYTQSLKFGWWGSTRLLFNIPLVFRHLSIAPAYICSGKSFNQLI